MSKLATTHMRPLGIVHGRFQPLHNGHMEYILTSKSCCRHIVVGIANPDPVLTKFHSANPHRSRPSANPFTYYERQLLIRHSLLDAGLLHDEFSIVPFPINRPELLGNYVPTDGTFFMTIFDEWGWAKYDLLRDQGFDVEILWEKDNSQKIVSASEIRRRMAAGEPWDSHVPAVVAKLVKELGLVERVSELLAKEWLEVSPGKE